MSDETAVRDDSAPGAPGPLAVSDWAYILVAGRIEISGPAGEIVDRPDIREVFLGRSAGDAPHSSAAGDLGSAPRPS